MHGVSVVAHADIGSYGVPALVLSGHGSRTAAPGWWHANNPHRLQVNYRKDEAKAGLGFLNHPTRGVRGRESVLLLVLVRLEDHVHLVAGGGDGEGNLVPAEATQNRGGLGFAIINCHVVVGAFL